MPTDDGVPPDVEAGPIVVAGDVEVVYYYFHPGPSDDDTPYVFGELRNTSVVPYQAPALPFSGPFFASEAPESFDDFSSAEIGACYGGFPINPAEDDPSALELREERTQRNGNEIQVQGEDFNGSSADVERVAVKAAIYDGDGRYVGDISDYLRVSIPSGRTAPFSVDHGYDTFHSFDPIDYAGNGEDAAYDLTVGYDSGVRVGCG